LKEGLKLLEDLPDPPRGVIPREGVERLVYRFDENCR
jgi:hypothetical protein